MVRYKAVIFDLDGTLVNSIADIADSMNKVLKANGFPIHDVEQYKAFVGRGMTNLVLRAIPENVRDDTRIKSCRDAMLAEYGANYLNKTRPYDGITDLLTELYQIGVKRAVFSNKVDYLTKKIIKELFPQYDFAVILGSGPELPEKPDPKGVLLISDRLQIAPEEIVYVGDSDVDMQTAHNADMSAAGALWGFRTRNELLTNGAQYLLEHPMDLIAILTPK